MAFHIRHVKYSHDGKVSLTFVPFLWQKLMLFLSPLVKLTLFHLMFVTNVMFIFGIKFSIYTLARLCIQKIDLNQIQLD